MLCGLLILLCVYTVLGFMLAWIAGMVAQEEVEVKTGVITLICSGVVSFLIDMGLAAVIPGTAESVGAMFVADLIVLTLMLNLIAKLSWKHSAIIAVIYTVVIRGVLFGVTMCAAHSTA
jgi:hypothetical protein